MENNLEKRDSYFCSSSNGGHNEIRIYVQSLRTKNQIGFQTKAQPSIGSLTYGLFPKYACNG